MQGVQYQPIGPSMPPTWYASEPASCPAAMARYLRRTSGEAAYCFARAMHEDAAWANDDWGAYWADVMRLI